VGELTAASIAERIQNEPQVLAIFNTKKDSATVFALVDAPHTFYLSTWICGDHRRKVLAQVRERLVQGLPCRLVSTQVVEAGVDLDFSLVLRAMAPLDSLVQAAGRCNRNGMMPTLGRCEVFDPAGGKSPKGAYRSAIDVTRRFLPGRIQEVGTPSLQAEYTAAFFTSTSTDREVRLDGGGSSTLQKLREDFNFPEVARASAVVEEETVAVIIQTYAPEAIKAELAKLHDGGSPRLAARRLSPYSVSLRPRELKRSIDQKLVLEDESGFHIWVGPYDSNIGIGKGSVFEPEELMA
jgi:CRISPR-associated endonuclease/helicase Cas3